MIIIPGDCRLVLRDGVGATDTGLAKTYSDSFSSKGRFLAKGVILLLC